VIDPLLSDADLDSYHDILAAPIGRLLLVGVGVGVSGVSTTKSAIS